MFAKTVAALTRFLADPPMWTYAVAVAVMIGSASVYGVILWLGHDFEENTIKNDREACKAMNAIQNDFRSTDKSQLPRRD